MRIIVARTAGFCMGVRRAMEMAVKALASAPPPVRSSGPLIHNRQVVALLAARGLKSENASGGTVVIRAHGVSADERQRLAAGAGAVVDASCPHVLASQRCAQAAVAAGKDVVLVGDAGHPEITALASYCEKAYIVADEETARQVALTRPFAVIAQTTFDRERYRRICDILQERFPNCVVHETICAATRQRQEEAAALARQTDALVVVGGKHSANTRRLAEIGRSLGKPVFHVENADEICIDDFKGFQTVGVTAGASTPGWLTEEVIAKLEEVPDWRPAALLHRFVRAAARSRMLTALGTACLLFAVAHLIRIRLVHGAAAMYAAAAFAFLAHTINRRHIPAETAGGGRPFDMFYRRHQRMLMILAWLGWGAAMLVAVQINFFAAGVLGFATAAAILYGVPLLPPSFKRRCLRDWPGSKDVLVAAAWTFVVVGMAVAASDGINLSAKKIAAASAIIFLLTYVKTVMLDLRDMESDHLLGIDTLPVWLGKARAISLLVFLHWVILAIIVLIAFLGGGAFAYLFILVPLYGVLALRILSSSGFKGETECQIIMDGQMLFAGLLAFLHKAAEKIL